MLRVSLKKTPKNYIEKIMQKQSKLVDVLRE